MLHEANSMVVFSSLFISLKGEVLRVKGERSEYGVLPELLAGEALFKHPFVEVAQGIIAV